jgi:predicted  nucleic acid-binding Zn-ribbon protein
MSRTARRRAFDAVSERCPIVESFINDAEADIQGALRVVTDRIKTKVSGPFRDALEEAFDEVINLEQQVSDLEDERDKAVARADDAEDELADTLRELASVRDELEHERSKHD